MFLQCFPGDQVLQLTSFTQIVFTVKCIIMALIFVGFNSTVHTFCIGLYPQGEKSNMTFH